MENRMTVIMIAIIAAMALVVFLIARNQKNMEQLNPDSSDALNKERWEHDNDRKRF